MDQNSRFTISVHESGYYQVSIPDYHGGEVVRAESYDSLLEVFEVLKHALNALLPYLSTEAQLLDDASLNEGRASRFDIASVRARKALALAESPKPNEELGEMRK